MNHAPPLDHGYYDPPGEPIQPSGGGARSARIVAKPFRWIDPATIPPRKFLYGRHYARKFTSLTAAAPGVGKSTLVYAEALAMASGKPLLGMRPPERCRVWVWNGEDPQEEIDRRIMAAVLHFDLDPQDFEDWLFADSGRENAIILAQQEKNGVKIATPVVDALIATIRANKIDVLTIDPFVSSHRVTENDNNAIDLVAKTWGMIADATSCAIDLVHHVRKTGGAEVQLDDARGAGSLVGAVRSARVINAMTDDEAARAGVENRRLHIRVDEGAKSNMSPPADKAFWYKLVSVELGNGDNVGVMTAWKWPDPLDHVTVTDLRAVQAIVASGQWRDSSQASDWVGKAVAQAMKLDTNSKKDKAKILGLLKIWKATGMLVIVQKQDAKRMMRDYVEVGTPADD